jgi:hypothetical protein
MKVTSEIILSNLQTLEEVKRDYPILIEYELESDSTNKRQIWSDAANYGLHQYLSFIDFLIITKENNQQPLFDHKIKNKEFQEVLERCAQDEVVKKILKTKSKISFTKLLNSDKWELYAGNLNYRRRKRYKNNFLASTAIIANFCIQNEIEILDTSRIGEFYTKRLEKLDPSTKIEFDLSNDVINFIVEKITKGNYDYRKLNLQSISKSISEKLARKIIDLDSGESVRFIDTSNFHKNITPGKIYKIVSKDFNSGRLTIQIENDLGYIRRYPYRLFESISDLRDSAISKLLGDLE